MSATNTTTNLGLSQFVNTDVPAWRQDYNGDMLKIDNAYTADISGATAETSADPSDYMKFYDVSATTNKKILISDLLKGAKVEDLTDTDITTPANDDGLVYDATAQKWENKPVVTGDLWAQNGAHNLLPNTATSQVDNGITFIVNDDGTVTLSGSVGTDRNYSITHVYDGTNYEFAGKTIIASGGGAIGWSLYMNLAGYDSDGNNVLDSYVREDNKMVAIPSSTKRLIVYIVISNEYAGSLPQTVYPMLRLSTDPSTTYTPYAMTNGELTEKIDAYAEYNLYDYGTNGCTVYAIGVRIGNFAVLQGKWFKSTGLTNPTSFISSLPSALLPYEDTTGSGIYIIKSSGAIETGLPKVTTSGNVFESATSAELTEGSFSIVYRAK